MLAKRKKTAELLGWYGIIAILIAYALVSFKLISGDGWTYQLLNLTGSLGIIAISIVKGVRQSVVLNIVWSAIAIVAIIRLIAAF